MYALALTAWAGKLKSRPRSRFLLDTRISPDLEQRVVESGSNGKRYGGSESWDPR